MFWVVMFFTLAERLGMYLVLLTYIALGLAYHPPAMNDLTQFVLYVGALSLGGVAIWTAYSVVRAALPDCGLMALATAAALAVIPGHVSSLSSHALLGIAEAAAGFTLLGLIRLAQSVIPRAHAATGELVMIGADGMEVFGSSDYRTVGAPAPLPSTSSAERSGHWGTVPLVEAGFWSGIALAAGPGALAMALLVPVSLFALGRGAGLRGRELAWQAGRGVMIAGAATVAVLGTVLLVARWLGTRPPAPSDIALTAAGSFAPWQAVASGVNAFWLPPGWETAFAETPLGWVLGILTVMSILGTGGYAVAAARRQAGLTEEERAAFGVFYLVAGLAFLAAAAVVARGAAPGADMLYPFIAPLALLGIIGFESWFPPMLRPLVVFALLVGLFGLNLYGLFLSVTT